MKQFKDRIEYFLIRFLFLGFEKLPLDFSSFLGGFFARAIGPFLPAHRIAKINLQRVYPGITRERQRALLLAMWDNMGRTVVEMAHMGGTRLYERIKVHGGELFPKEGQQVLFFSGHIGNWELLSSVAYQRGVPLALIYRTANNRRVDELIQTVRGQQCTDQFPKGAAGAVKLARSIKAGHSIAMLIDQKMNDGISVPFFGTPAMTAPAIAELSLRYNLPILPARVIRTGGCHFAATVYPPIEIAPTGDKDRDVLAIMTRINATVEEWIREHPDQWFWVHQRWPKENYKK